MAKPSGFSSGFSGGFGVGRYHYELVPWQWLTSPFPRWELPFPVVGSIDLRPLPAQALAGGSPQGFAFVASMQPQSGVLIANSLHLADENVTTAMQDAWESAMGYRPQGAKLVDLPFDQLTTGSDPSGENGPKPLVPTVNGVLELHLGGHSPVKSERFKWGIHPHTAKVRDLLRRDFEQQWEETNGSDHCLRCLDFTCKKYRVDDWKEFVPSRLHSHVPGRLPHQTTITENFDGTNSTTVIGNTLSWTSVTGTWGKFNNDGYKSASGATQQLARADSDLSSSDHYCQVLVAADGSPISSPTAGPACRFSSSATTCYCTGNFSNTQYLMKFVTGTQTNLSNTAHTYTTEVLKIQSSGSTIGYYAAGSLLASITDTSIAGNTRGGLTSSEVNETFDDWEAADLAVAARASLIGGKLVNDGLLIKGLVA